MQVDPGAGRFEAAASILQSKATAKIEIQRRP
jgi:hypothetical protein